MFPMKTAAKVTRSLLWLGGSVADCEDYFDRKPEGRGPGLTMQGFRSILKVTTMLLSNEVLVRFPH